MPSLRIQVLRLLLVQVVSVALRRQPLKESKAVYFSISKEWISLTVCLFQMATNGLVYEK